MSYSPQKADFLSFFSRGEHDKGQQFKQLNFYRDHFILYWVFFTMEEEKFPKQKPHTSLNRRLSVAKNPEGNMTTAKKNVKIFILEGGTWQRGNMAKGITVIVQTVGRCHVPPTEKC